MSEVLLGKVESVIQWIPLRNFRRLNGKRPALTLPTPISLNSKKIRKQFPKSNCPTLLQGCSMAQMHKNRENREKPNISYFDDRNQTRVTKSYEISSSTSKGIPIDYAQKPIEISIHGKSPKTFADSKISSNILHFSLKSKSKDIARNLNRLFFNYHARSPTQNINLSSNTFRKALFPQILRNQTIPLTPNPKYKQNGKKANIRDATMNTETFDEDKWLDSKYLDIFV